jgi:hypothetical protein
LLWWHEFCYRKANMAEVRPEDRPDPKAIVFLIFAVGLAALELWGLIRFF